MGRRGTLCGLLFISTTESSVSSQRTDGLRVRSGTVEDCESAVTRVSNHAQPLEETSELLVAAPASKV